MEVDTVIVGVATVIADSLFSSHMSLTILH